MLLYCLLCDKKISHELDYSAEVWLCRKCNNRVNLDYVLYCVCCGEKVSHEVVRQWFDGTDNFEVWRCLKCDMEYLRQRQRTTRYDADWLERREEYDDNDWTALMRRRDEESQH
jgi:hypothetical protein